MRLNKTRNIFWISVVTVGSDHLGLNDNLVYKTTYYEIIIIGVHGLSSEKSRNPLDPRWNLCQYSSPVMGKRRSSTTIAFLFSFIRYMLGKSNIQWV
jgi:hypothetical protein